LSLYLELLSPGKHLDTACSYHTDSFSSPERLVIVPGVTTVDTPGNAESRTISSKEPGDPIPWEELKKELELLATKLRSTTLLRSRLKRFQKLTE
jgi:hypothetical protein